MARERALLFWLGCIPLRVFLATRGNDPYLRALAVYIGGRWVLGMETSHVGKFGGPAWWWDERPVHGALWLGYAATGSDRWLKADVIFGMANWLLKDQPVSVTE